MEQLKNIIASIASIQPQDINLIETTFRIKHFRKGDFFNQTNQIGTHLAFVKKGLFRIYYTDEQTGEQHNIFFFKENQFMSPFKSFLTQSPCHYTIEAVEDSEILQATYNQMQTLYAQSHALANMGRIVAEQYFYASQARTESFLFKSAEERYLDMIAFYPDIFQRVPLLHIASYLGIRQPSLSRIRKKLASKL